MLDTIILLTGETERPVLAEALRCAEPGITVLSPPWVAALPDDLSGARLVTFLHPEIVPAEVLGRLGFGGYNIHPGPPDYPGRWPAAFALYDGAERFGATLHEMAPRVDSGKICDVEDFAVPGDCDLPRLEELAYGASLRLFFRWAESLVSPLHPPRLPLPWGTRRCTRHAFDELCRIPPDADEAERARRKRACGAAVP